ncbi:MAG: hypothetical protein AAFQ68_22785, partial [Bacteroidota bacterium]
MYQRLIKSYPYPLYLLSLCMMLVGLPLGRALMSIGIGVMASAALLEGVWEDKLRRLRRRPFAVWLSGFALVFILSIAYSENVQAGFTTFLMYLPVLIIPISVALFPPLPVVWRKRLVWLFILACLTATILSILIGAWQSIQAGEAFRFHYFYYSQLTSYLRLHPAYFTLFIGLAIWGLYWWVGEQLRAKESVNWYRMMAL